MLRSRFLLGCVLAVLLALGGCRGEPEQPSETTLAERDSVAAEPEPVNPFAEPARRALRIELGLDGYRTVEGTWAAGDTASTFTAHFAGDTLRLIEEELSLGAVGEGTNVYYFEDDALFYAVQNEIRLDPQDDTRRDTSRVRVALDARGDVIASVRTVNGASVPVRARTVRGVRGHAETLCDRAHALREEATEPAV